MRVAVTGGSGRIGRHVVAELIGAGHTVVNADRQPPPHVQWLYDQRGAEYFVLTDITSYGDVVAVLGDVEAVVHLAAIPNPTGHVPGNVFTTNMSADFNVLEAAAQLGIGKVACASSINALGAAFNQGIVAPRYFPIDEQHETRCEEVYSITKHLGEELAAAFARRGGMQLASLRFTWVVDEAIRARAAAAREERSLQVRRAKAFWCWVDVRDVASACRLAVESSWEGHEVFWVNATDTDLDVPTMAALEQWYPGVPVQRPLAGYAAALDISKAERLLGWHPEHAWHA